MRKITIKALLLAFVLMGFHITQAQSLDASSFATVTQKVGFSEVKIEYSRPNVKSRVIFGGLVPYGKVWRLGANSSTKLFIREELIIEDQYHLKPGVYAMFAIVNKDDWTIIFNKDPWQWGAFQYSESTDALRVKIKTEPLKEKVETFTIQFNNVCPNCAEIQFAWEYTKASLKIKTNADDKVMSQIKTFTSHPEGKLAEEYHLASKYYLETERDLNQALQWADKALSYEPGAYWITHTKAEIYAKMGDYNKAIEMATRSKEEAKAKNQEDFVRLNEMEIAKWKIKQ